MKPTNLSALAVAAAISLVASTHAHALNIVPYFSAGITSSSNAAEIESSVNNAIQFYHNFNNQTNVNILYELGSAPGFLGENFGTYYYDQYSDYTSILSADLAANPQNVVLRTALANLSKGNIPPLGDPTDGEIGVDRWMVIQSSFFDAQGQGPAGGIGADGVFGDGDFDGVVVLSNEVDNGVPLVSYTDDVGPTQYAAMPIIQHETDEILGIGGGGSTAGAQNALGFMGTDGSLDLYRYSAPGVPSLTADPNANAYFSIDGGQTDIMGFNQVPGGDHGDWAKSSCSGPQHVQDVFGCPGIPSFGLTLSSPEVIALEATGYNLYGVPEPATWAMMLLGFGGLGGVMRMNRTRCAVSVAA